jgi:hypothetical protein
LKMLICKQASMAAFGTLSLHPFVPSSLHPFIPSSLHPFFTLVPYIFILKEAYEVKPVYRNLENLLLSIIHFTYTPVGQHGELLNSIPHSKIYSIVKECCEMYLSLFNFLSLSLTHTHTLSHLLTHFL